MFARPSISLSRPDPESTVIGFLGDRAGEIRISDDAANKTVLDSAQGGRCILSLRKSAHASMTAIACAVSALPMHAGGEREARRARKVTRHHGIDDAVDWMLAP